MLAEGLPVGRPPLHLVARHVEDLLQYLGIGLAVGPDGANVAGKAEGLEDRLIEGDVAVLGTEEGSVEIEEDNLARRVHGDLGIYTFTPRMERDAARTAPRLLDPGSSPG